MIQATQLRRGNTILMNGELYQVVDYQHITPGNWRGMVQTKLRKLSTGSIIDHRFRSEDRVERALPVDGKGVDLAARQQPFDLALLGHGLKHPHLGTF